MDRRAFCDVNNFTGPVSFHQMASAGALVVGILATDGESFISEQHAEQAAHAHEAGLRAWHYHFCRPEADPTATGEAAHFWRNVKPWWRDGDRLVLDVEVMHPLGPGNLVEYVRRVDTLLHNISGVASCCYMPDSMFRLCGPKLQVISSDFWIASWGGRVARLGHGRRMVAQQTAGGKEGEPRHYPGVQGAVDLDRLQRWYARRLQRSRPASR